MKVVGDSSTGFSLANMSSWANMNDANNNVCIRGAGVPATRRAGKPSNGSQVALFIPNDNALTELDLGKMSFSDLTKILAAHTVNIDLNSLQEGANLVKHQAGGTLCVLIQNDSIKSVNGNPIDESQTVTVAGTASRPTVRVYPISSLLTDM